VEVLEEEWVRKAIDSYTSGPREKGDVDRWRWGKDGDGETKDECRVGS
jgi:hypothetical protein